MKRKNWIYAVATVFILVGVVLKLTHMAYSSLFMLIGGLGGGIYLLMDYQKLSKRNKALEAKEK